MGGKEQGAPDASADEPGKDQANSHGSSYRRRRDMADTIDGLLAEEDSADYEEEDYEGREGEQEDVEQQHPSQQADGAPAEPSSHANGREAPDAGEDVQQQAQQGRAAGGGPRAPPAAYYQDTTLLPGQQPHRRQGYDGGRWGGSMGRGGPGRPGMMQGSNDWQVRGGLGGGPMPVPGQGPGFPHRAFPGPMGLPMAPGMDVTAGGGPMGFQQGSGVPGPRPPPGPPPPAAPHGGVPPPRPPPGPPPPFASHPPGSWTPPAQLSGPQQGGAQVLPSILRPGPTGGGPGPLGPQPPPHPPPQTAGPSHNGMPGGGPGRPGPLPIPLHQHPAQMMQPTGRPIPPAPAGAGSGWQAMGAAPVGGSFPDMGNWTGLGIHDALAPGIVRAPSTGWSSQDHHVVPGGAQPLGFARGMQPGGPGPAGPQSGLRTNKWVRPGAAPASKRSEAVGQGGEAAATGGQPASKESELQRRLAMIEARKREAAERRKAGGQEGGSIQPSAAVSAPTASGAVPASNAAALLEAQEQYIAQLRKLIALREAAAKAQGTSGGANDGEGGESSEHEKAEPIAGEKRAADDSQGLGSGAQPSGASAKRMRRTPQPQPQPALAGNGDHHAELVAGSEFCEESEEAGAATVPARPASRLRQPMYGAPPQNDVEHVSAGAEEEEGGDTNDAFAVEG